MKRGDSVACDIQKAQRRHQPVTNESGNGVFFDRQSGDLPFDGEGKNLTHKSGFGKVRPLFFVECGALPGKNAEKKLKSGGKMT